MSFFAISLTAVRFDEYSVWVDLSDGRVLGVPVAWFARLFSARREQREGRASMWTFSVAGLLEGLGDRTRRGVTVAA